MFKSLQFYFSITNSIPSNRVFYLLSIPRNTKLNFRTMCEPCSQWGQKGEKGRGEATPPGLNCRPVSFRLRWKLLEASGCLFWFTSDCKALCSGMCHTSSRLLHAMAQVVHWLRCAWLRACQWGRGKEIAFYSELSILTVVWEVGWAQPASGESKEHLLPTCTEALCGPLGTPNQRKH